MLIGSRKFTEGWNSWRVSTMGLINFAKGEGSQAIQLFGRGVRLKGYGGCLKRSRKLDTPVATPKYIELLETLTIFGVKAQYMEDFKSYLEREETPTNDRIYEFHLPVISRFDEASGKKLHVIKVKDGANFKKQARRLVLDAPDEGFLHYLVKNKTVIDCRSKIQTIDSNFRFELKAMPEESVIPKEKLTLLDYRRIFEELEQYKSEKRYLNISIVQEKLIAILQTDGWYGLLIPQNYLNINSLVKVEAVTDYAIMALKTYMDKFFKYEKERWEAPLLEYAVLDADDSNFVEEYTITYAKQYSLDTTDEELSRFITEIATNVQENNGLVIQTLIPGVGHHFLVSSMVEMLQPPQKRLEGLHVSPVREGLYPGDVLAVYRNLYIVARFELPVAHMVLFHTHKGGVRVGLGIAVASFAHGGTKRFISFPPLQQLGHVFPFLLLWAFPPAAAVDKIDTHSQLIQMGL